MSDSMYFPHTVEEFMELYKMVDSEEIYSNGIEYVPIFRMKQWFNANPNVINHDAKIRVDAINEMKDKLQLSAIYTKTENGWSGMTVDTIQIDEIAEELKEQK